MGKIKLIGPVSFVRAQVCVCRGGGGGGVGGMGGSGQVCVLRVSMSFHSLLCG